MTFLFKKSYENEKPFVRSIIPFIVLLICSGLLFILDQETKFNLFKYLIIGFCYNISSVKIILSSISYVK
jgi:hypothetical protein